MVRRTLGQTPWQHVEDGLDNDEMTDCHYIPSRTDGFNTNLDVKMYGSQRVID